MDLMLIVSLAFNNIFISFLFLLHKFVPKQVKVNLYNGGHRSVSLPLSSPESFILVVCSDQVANLSQTQSLDMIKVFNL